MDIPSACLMILCTAELFPEVLALPQAATERIVTADKTRHKDFFIVLFPPIRFLNLWSH